MNRHVTPDQIIECIGGDTAFHGGCIYPYPIEVPEDASCLNFAQGTIISIVGGNNETILQAWKVSVEELDPLDLEGDPL